MKQYTNAECYSVGNIMNEAENGKTKTDVILSP